MQIKYIDILWICMSNITSLLSCFEHFIIVIEINAIINIPNNVEISEEKCMIIA